MHQLFISLMIAILVGCSSSPQQALQPDVQMASEEEIEGATQGVLRCAGLAIRLYDDAVSPADTVGKAVSSHCRKEISMLMYVSQKGMDRHYQSGFMEAFNPEELFTSLVLQNRTRN